MKVYVSLTSIFQNQLILLKTLQSIINQTLLPDKIYLYLSKEPYLLDKGFTNGLDSIQSDLKQFIKNYNSLITIQFVKNTGSYRKLLPLLEQKKDEDCLILTIDDDTVYHPKLIEHYVEDYNTYHCCISYRGFQMKMKYSMDELNYKDRETINIGKHLFNFHTGKGGVLYHPSMFLKTYSIIFDESIYKSLCPAQDDVWFVFCRIVNNIECFIDNSKKFMRNDLTNVDTSLYVQFNNKNDENTKAMKHVIQYLRDHHFLDNISSSHFDSNTYWNDRYLKGGNSGEGSYGHFAIFKGDILQKCIENLNIQSIIDYGCGDGNQALYYKCSKYIGIDVSQKAIDLCKKKFYYDIHKEFYLDNDFFKSFDSSKKVDCAISCDVILHLINPSLYISYLKNLFSLSTKYVIIYSYDCDLKHTEHVKYHNFTKTIEELFPNWILLNQIMNPNDKKTGFYIYSKMNDNEISIVQSWKKFIHLHLMPLLKNVSLEGNIYTSHLSINPLKELSCKQYNITHFFQQESILSKPIKILEIGFNSGFSALLMLLSHPNAIIECIDIGDHPYVLTCFEELKKHFGHRISLIIENSHTYLPKLKKQNKKYDFIHMDGDHSQSGSFSDFQNCLSLSNTNTILLVDDTNISYINDLCNKSIQEKKTVQYSMFFFNIGSKKHRFLKVL